MIQMQYMYMYLVMCVTNEEVHNVSAHQVIIGALRVNLLGTFGSK